MLPKCACLSGSAAIFKSRQPGTCQSSLPASADRHSLLFGDVVFGATSTKRVHLHNFGDLGVKFRFDVPTKLLNTFSVEPSEATALRRCLPLIAISL